MEGEAGKGLELSTCPLQRLSTELLFQEIEPDPQPDVPLGIGVEDRMDGREAPLLLRASTSTSAPLALSSPVMKSDRQTIPCPASAS